MGDATSPTGGDTKITVHVCNGIGGWGAGFVVALSRRSKAPERTTRAWHVGAETAGARLGAVRLVPVEPTLHVATLTGQHGITPSRPARAAALRA